MATKQNKRYDMQYMDPVTKEMKSVCNKSWRQIEQKSRSLSVLNGRIITALNPDSGRTTIWVNSIYVGVITRVR